jgi:ATP-dependent RNA helicase DHX57
LANHPEHFNGLSHLIIDEIHERSVDTDILCLLCRRLLQQNDSIRLVLMSATLSASMYQEYFGVPEPPIKVGAKRFSVAEVYLEELSLGIKLPKQMEKTIASLVEQCRKMNCANAPSGSYMEKLYTLVAHVASVVGKPGSSVLIFVPGMNDIIALTEAIEDIHAPDVFFNCIPIHSDVSCRLVAFSL